ncbi:MAG TPA: serine hydrolase domain-containing protein [Pyrinomonadaceae bacterium]
MKSVEISAFLQSRIEAKDFPSAVYLAAEKGEIVLRDAVGLAVVEPEKIRARLDTIYDLASLTKVLITGLLCAKLIETGEINLSDKAAKYFAEFDTDEKRGITLGNLLTHTSGFPAWFPFYTSFCDKNRKKECVLSVIVQSSLGNPINSKVVYSDFNFLLLGFLLEKFYGESLDKLAEREIFAPLGLQNTFYNPPKELRERIAASEKGNEYEKQTCVNSGFDVSNYNWRDYQIRGEVHDGNCYFMDGVSGHAGLFSTAEEVFKIARQFLPESTTLLQPETCALFRTNFTEGLNEARSVAFQLAETPDSTAGEALSRNSFGHLGFTGTSLWIDPQKERIFILLTNRTHNRRLPFVLLNSVRRRFHESAARQLNEAETGSLQY